MACAEVVVSSSQATSQSLPISVLDLIFSRAGEPASSAIAQSVELARHVEQLGYKRYWVAEHHSIQGLVCSATPILIGHIEAATKKIRVGSGGVMLPNHAPLVVAKPFGTLESMYPGRIDLGLGRAPGGDFQTMRALRRGLAQDGEASLVLLEELRTYLRPERPGQLVKAIPGQNSNVPIPLLGSSDFSAQLAAALGLPFAFAAHFAPDAWYAAAQFYRERFQPRSIANTVSAHCRTGDCSGDRCGSSTTVYCSTTAFSTTHSMRAGGIVASVDSMVPLWLDGERSTVQSRLRAAIVGIGHNHAGWPGETRQ
jgi:luciferase family oxidoreductase group 1